MDLITALYLIVLCVLVLVGFVTSWLVPGAHRPRPRAPSWDEISVAHRLETDPPAAQFFDRMVGRAQRHAIIRLVKNRWLIVAIANGLGWFAHHLATRAH